MVVVNGNIDSVQSSVDFYLRVTSKEEVLDSRIMRDKFFALFDKEDSYRKDSFLVFQESVSSSSYTLTDNPHPILVGEELVYNESEEVIWGSLDIKNNNLEIENSIDVSSPDKLEEEKTSLETEKGFSWGNRSHFPISDDDFISQDFEEVEYDEVDSLDNESESDWVDEEDRYFSEDEEDGGWENWGSDEDDDTIDEELTTESEGAIGDLAANLGLSLDNFDTFFEPDIVEDEEVISKPKNKVVEVSTKDISPDVVEDIPTDLRDFVKKYPNCEISFALKYFSRKEIDRQLNLGRIYKRKNRLLI